MELLKDTQFVGAKFFLSQWKADHSIAQIEEFVSRLTKNPHFDSHVCLLAVPFPFLQDLSKIISHPRVVLGSNAMQSSQPGTFTASVSGKLLKNNHARFVLIGTALSRKIHPNNELNVSNQIKSALKAELTPFYCIGESLQQQQAGEASEVLLQQCQEGLTGLSPFELSRLCIVYEAPWLQTTPEKLSLERLVSQYHVFKQAVQESVPQDVFPALKLIDALPMDLEEPEKLLEAIQGKGLYASSPEIFFSCLNDECEQALKFEEVIYTPQPSELEEIAPELLDASEEEKEEEIHAPAIASQISPLKPVEDKEKVFEEATEKEAVEKEVEEEEFEAAEQEEENALVAALKKEKARMPLPEETTEQLNAEEEKLGIELNADENAAIPALFLEESQAATEESRDQELPARIAPPLEAIPPRPFTEEEEIAVTSAPKGDFSMPLLEEGPSDIENQEQQELHMKLQHLQSLDKSLADCYQQIHEKLDTLPALRETFPERLNKMTNDLNKLDPALQEQINRGNIAFFTENPDKMKEAGSVLLQIQEINLLLQKTAAIPRDLDRILSKSRDIRKALEAEWTYFRISRQRIKESYPDFPFPAPPSQLLIPEPKIDITPMDFGPSALVSKRIAVVKTPPLPKQG